MELVIDLDPEKRLSTVDLIAFGPSMSFYPDFILILSKFYPDKIWIKCFFQLYSDFIHFFSKIWIKGHGRHLTELDDAFCSISLRVIGFLLLFYSFICLSKSIDQS